jgi:DivIVA domain-containing protein
VVTVLEYLVIAAAIGLVVFVLAVFVFGRGEQMAPLSPRISPAELPDGAIAGDDVRRIRFSLAVRGYRMSDVDWTLDRLSEELDRLHRRVAELDGEAVPPGVSPRADDEDLFVDAEPDLVVVGARAARHADDDETGFASAPPVTEPFPVAPAVTTRAGSDPAEASQAGASQRTTPPGAEAPWATPRDAAREEGHPPA